MENEKLNLPGSGEKVKADTHGLVNRLKSRILADGATFDNLNSNYIMPPRKRSAQDATPQEEPVASHGNPFTFIIENKSIFIMGCFGGMAPIVIQIANICRGALSHDCVLPTAASFFLGFIAALILGMIGGVVVCAMREKDYGKAIFLGVSAPALILSALAPSPLQRNMPPANTTKEGGTNGTEDKKHSWNFNFFVTSAYAQNTPEKNISHTFAREASPIGIRFVEVFSRNKDRSFDIAYYSSKNIEMGSQEIEPAIKTLVLAPAGATYVRFKAGDSISEKFQLPQDASIVSDYVVKVVFQEEYSFLSFFTQTPKIVGHFAIDPTQRRKIEPGKEGWIYLGMYVGGRWIPDKRHTDLETDPEQAKGKVIGTAFENTHFRDHPNKAGEEEPDKCPVISLGQRVEVMEVRQSDKIVNAWWARVRVKS